MAPGVNGSGTPMTRTQVVDAYFMEHRARLLDVAAFLDRVDRAAVGDDDFRMRAFRAAVAILDDGRPDRARRVLELLSDPSTEPVAEAGMKGATGAHDPAKGGG
ncbi:MAG: hypothetical protein ACOYO7_02450 [Phycisphaerales bacterium]|jgi:hypothetical protein